MPARPVDATSLLGDALQISAGQTGCRHLRHHSRLPIAWLIQASGGWKLLRDMGNVLQALMEFTRFRFEGVDPEYARAVQLRQRNPRTNQEEVPNAQVLIHET